eukprot:g13255.t1
MDTKVGPLHLATLAKVGVVAGGIFFLARRAMLRNVVPAGKTASDGPTHNAARTTAPSVVQTAASPVAQRRGYTVVSWNVAAVNNNPFEYWVSHPDPAYNQLMRDVQAFLDQPGERDVPVNAVFSQSMFKDLQERMAALGWTGLDEVSARWESDLSRRKIIQGFLKDKSIGDKRLASMPDRVTNTVRTTQGIQCRPTVINCFEGRLDSPEWWWKQWTEWMFHIDLHIRAKD